MDSITQVFQSLSYVELLKCKSSLDEILKEKKHECLSLLPSDFVDVTPNFLEKGSVCYQAILSELESLGFKSDKTETKWLTSTGERYVWSSHNGHETVKEPVDISKYPGISDLMRDINTKFNCNMNSCLASFYNSGCNGTRYHADDESSLDPNQGIYVVSFGAKRIIDIVSAAGDKRFKGTFTIDAEDGSLYVMKAGCQDNFLHKVRTNVSVKESRFSLSFRHMIPKPSPVESAVATQPSAETTVTAESSLATAATTTTTTTTTTTSTTAPAATPLYYRTAPRKPKVRKTTVLFGTSITKYIRTKQLGFRGRKVVNISQSGAKIKDISENVREFYHTHQSAKDDDIEKIIFSFGTNDIKYSKHGVSHLRKYIHELVDSTQSLFPTAVILFQCCLPIRCLYPYIARNVLDFNDMLRDFCHRNRFCVYIDCFSDFLTPDYIFCNKDLYHDWLHLNNRGVGVLSTWLRYVVNENCFDRVVSNLVGL